ncbi:unnamed protein product, partial [Mesorhabditis belari]|uniref:Uncharacterized protein n=1 Tax=Mesorhabditis belari TaxID=2138241 RepID=A0AAF3E8S3_9BILA
MNENQMKINALQAQKDFERILPSGNIVRVGLADVNYEELMEEMKNIQLQSFDNKGASGKDGAVDTLTLLVILGTAACFFMGLLVGLVCCYRRRSREAEDLSIKHSTNSIPDPPANRSISFGKMPSWREERQRQKANRYIFSALERIREAEERSRSDQNGSVTGSQQGSMSGGGAESLKSLESGRSYLSDGHWHKYSQGNFSSSSNRRCYSTSQLRIGESNGWSNRDEQEHSIDAPLLENNHVPCRSDSRDFNPHHRHRSSQSESPFFPLSYPIDIPRESPTEQPRFSSGVFI